jgi:hypothetical protein
MIGRVNSLYLCFAVSLSILARSAAGQQIVNATCSGAVSETSYNGYSLEVPPASGTTKTPIDLSIGCSSVSVRVRVNHNDPRLAIQVDQVADLSTIVYYNVVFQLRVGSEGAVVLHDGPGDLRVDGEYWVSGTTRTIAPDSLVSLYLSDIENGLGGSASYACELEVVSGSVSSFGVFGSCDLNYYSVSCSGTQLWSIGDSDLACDGCSRLWNAGGGMTVATRQIAGSAWAGPDSNSASFYASFTLDNPALVRYESWSPDYSCDTHASLDGQSLWAPGEYCADALVGYMNLAAGPHGVGLSVGDAVTSGFSITIVGAPGVDCNCNGWPDITEILWFDRYGYSQSGGDPDLDNDGQLDACRMTGDVDDSGIVDSADLAILLESWGKSGAADIDCDGIVNSVDLVLLLDHWSY